MTTPNPFQEVFCGSRAQQARGFLIQLPSGWRARAPAEAALRAAYGGVQHPDIRRLEPDGKGQMIKIDMVREAMRFLYAASTTGTLKTLVLYEAHRLNPEAANALLKSLEEPTAHTRIVLLSDRPWLLPVTILSRCIRLPFRPDAAETTAELAAWMEAAGTSVPEPGKAARALSVADGDPEIAASILAHDLLSWSDRVRDWLGTPGAGAAPPMPALGGKKAGGTPLRIAALVLHGLLVHSARPDASRQGAAIRGWTAATAIAAATRITPLIEDIDRAGIEARTRLTRLLLAARGAA